MKDQYAIAVHGGAGSVNPAKLSDEKRNLYEYGLRKAIEAGLASLSGGCSALDAVEHAVRILEDDAVYNAAHGSVLTNDEVHELDAAIMSGDGWAGAVASVKRVKNPVSLARGVLGDGHYVLLVSSGAEQFAESIGMELVDNAYFFTQKRYHQLKAIQHTHRTQLDHVFEEEEYHRKHGTVGAVALDAFGHLAAATSTGGLTNKKFGRVGDTPIIGAGTYANNKTCAISATGLGEAYIRCSAAHDISCLMEYGGLTLHEASWTVIFEKIPAQHGEGGVISIDRMGNIAMPFNTSGMYRGFGRSNGELSVGILAADL